MSNPCINRWGLNTFWHNYWYSDLRYSLYLQQDKVFTEIVRLYLAYGTAYNSIFFRHMFWYKSSTTQPALQLETYYRWVTTRGREAHEIATSRLRLTTVETFQTRVSVLRLDSWFVINIYWFQPDKLKNKRAKRSRPACFVAPFRDVQSSLTSLSKINTSFNTLISPSKLQNVTYNF